MADYLKIQSLAKRGVRMQEIGTRKLRVLSCSRLESFPKNHEAKVISKSFAKIKEETGVCGD